MTTQKSNHSKEAQRTSPKHQAAPQGQRGQHQGQNVGGGDDRSARGGGTKPGAVDDSQGSRTGSKDNDDPREPGDRGREGEGKKSSMK